MDNEVLVHVRVKNDGKIGFESFAKDADKNARDISTSFASRLTENIRARFSEQFPRIFGGGGNATTAPQTAGRTWGDAFGRAAGENISTRINERITQDVNGRWRDVINGARSDGGRGGQGGRGGDATVRGDRDRVHVDVDVDKQSLLQRMFGAGKEAAGKFGDGFKGVLGTLFSGDIITMLIKGVSVTALGGAFASVFGAAITSGLGLALGGGAIGIGIAGAFKDPRIQLAAKGMLDRVKSLFADYSSNFVPVIEEFIAPSNKGGGGLIGVLQQITPMVSQLGKELAPVAQHLGQGIIGFLQNALPPIIRAIDDSRPIIDALADKLPKVGAAIGDLIETIAKRSPEASVFFRDLIDTVVSILGVIGPVIAGATHLYMVFRTVFTGMIELAFNFLDAAAYAFSWVPGVGPKLASAAAHTKAFRDKMNANLRGIDKDVDITVRIRTVGLGVARAALDIGRQLRALGYAHGGVTGAATGGLHGGLRMVGEHGPELVDLPPGTQVHSNPDTERMMAGLAGGGQPLIVQLVLDGKVLAQQLVEPTRELVRGQGRGSVQGFYGVPGVA